jgi:hypothetical protein
MEAVIVSVLIFDYSCVILVMGGDMDEVFFLNKDTNI